MHRYYKISHEWAVKLGEADSAPRHPDGMHLVTPNIGARVADILALGNGGHHLLPAEALEAIGAIGLTVAEALASDKGELRHDQPAADDTDETAENPTEQPDNLTTPQPNNPD